MRLSPDRSLAVIALAAVCAAGWAQDAPTEEAPTTQEVAPKLNSLTLGFTNKRVSDDKRRLDEFGTVPSGFTLTEFQFARPFDGVGASFNVALRGRPDDDYWYGGGLVTADGTLSLKASTLRRGFYYVPLTPTGTSLDRVGEATAQYSIAPNVAAYALFRKTERNQRYAPPLDSRRNTTEVHGAGITAATPVGHIGVSVSESRFTSPDFYQPNTVHSRLAATYSADLSPSFSLAATGAWTKVRRLGVPDNNVRSLGVSANLDLSPTTLVLFDMSRQDLSLPGVQSAYDQQRFSTGLRLVQKIKGWSFQAGYRHREAEHVRADRTFVDVPSWDTYDFRLSGRLTPELRMTMRGSWDNLTESAVPGTIDPHQLIWDDKLMGQVKIDGGNGTTNGYVVYTFRFRQNKQRSVEVGWHNFAAGFSRVFSSNLVGYAEASYDVFSAAGEVEGTSETLKDYFPNSFNAAIGLDWAKSETESVSGSLNTFATNNVKGTQFTLAYRKALSPDHSIELSFSPWQYTDRLYGLTGYNATIFSLNYKVKF